MGRVDDGIAVARHDGVIFTCFGDMLRVPGSEYTLLDAKAQGADIRMVYSPLDALRIARENPDREVVFFAIGFETTAPSTALTLKRAKAEGITNFSCVCNHVTIVPPLRALLESPDLRLDGFIGPGHVCTVVGARPFEFIPADYGRPVVISGFEPLDILQSILMILRQLGDGRCEVENQYTRVVPQEGNLRALEVMAEVFELRPHFEWRGLGFISQSALRLSRRLPRVRRRAAVRGPRRPRRRPQGVPVRRGAQGRDQAVGVQGVRHRLHARARDRDVHGLARGRVRRLLQLRPLRPRAGGGVSDRRSRSDREQRVLEIIETARAKRPRFRDEQITLAHGAGGKATQTLIEGLLVPALRVTSRELADAGRRRRRLAMTTDSFVVKPLRFPGGSIGELAVNGTVNDLAVAGARPLALTVSMILEEGLDADVLRAEVEAIARAARAAGRRDRRRRHEGRRARRRRPDVPVHDRGRASSTRARELAPHEIAPGDQVLVSGPIGEHGTAIMLARDEFDLDAEIESDTCSLWPAVDALLEAAGDDLHCMRDATRGGVASVLNELARASADVGRGRARRTCRSRRSCAAAAELLGIDPMYVANEGRLVAFVAPDAADEALARCEPCPAASRRRRSARCGASRRGWCWWRRALAAGG